MSVQEKLVHPESDPAPEPKPVNAVAGDPLTDALLYLAAHHGRALSREALLSGLPIMDGQLTVALFERAARRAGLEAEPVKREVEDLSLIHI